MKHILPVAAYLSLMILVSCDDSKEQTAVPSVLPASLSPVTTVANDSAAALNNSTGVALNPKHGEPGHRCDIPVGTPLNAPAANSSTQSTIAASSPASTPVILPAEVPKINATDAKLNPKHGEPGHRCDIAVGAPLNSKPSQ